MKWEKGKSSGNVLHTIINPRQVFHLFQQSSLTDLNYGLLALAGASTWNIDWVI